MHSLKVALAAVLLLPALTIRTVFGADTVALPPITGEIHGLSGNFILPGYTCGSSNLTYDFTVLTASGSSELNSCCGIFMNQKTPMVTNTGVKAELAYDANIQITRPGELCSGGPPNIQGVPECFDTDIHQTVGELGRPARMAWIVYLRRNSKSKPIAEWSVLIADPKAPLPRHRGGYIQLANDGKSTATATSKTGESLTWQITADDTGSTLSGNVLTAGTKRGTIQLTAITTNTDPCWQKDFYFDVGPDAGDCPACQGKTVCAIPKNNSVEILFDLGPSLKTPNSSFIELKSELPTVDLGNPGLLRYGYIRPDVTKITNSAGWLRQVTALEAIVDIVTNSASSYSLKYYYRTNVTGMSNGLLQFVGSPYQTFTVELVGGDTNQVRLTESLGGAVTDFVWATNGWTMISPGSLRQETKLVSVSGGIRTESTTITSGGGSLVAASTVKWQTNSLGVGEIIEKVTGSGASAQTNSYLYETNGRLRQEIRGDGSWHIYVYDPQGRVTEHYHPFLNSAPTTNSALCRLTESTYTNSVVSGSGDDAGLQIFTPRRVIEYVQGTEVSRRYTVIKEGERREILCPNPGTAWNDANNQVTITYLKTDSRYLNQPSKIVNPDGTVQLFTYTKYPILPGDATQYDQTVVLSGAPDGTGNNITRGTKEETWVDRAGRTIVRQVTDIPSQLLRSKEVYTYDQLGRLTNTVYLDGTSVSQVHDCCGVTSRTDRDGTVTTYTYDALKRELTSTRDGISASNVWDAAGNVLATYRLGTNGSAIRVSASAYDTAGRLLATTNALDQVTLYAESTDASGVTTRTTTNPDTSTRIETIARDRAPLSVSGTSVLPVRYTNGVASIGGYDRFYSQEIKLLTNETDSAEWVKSVNDGLGRTIETQFPDNSTNRAVYNAAGQLASEVDPDGVVMLYSYDDLGQVAYRALDVDRNGSIDLGGIDRVSATVSDVVSNSFYGATVRRSFTYVWNTTNDATSTLLSESSSSVDGRQSWSIFNGLTSSSRMDYLGNGATRITQTGPDGTQSIQEFQSGRALSSTVSNATLGILQQQTTGYDAHHRQSSVTDLRTGTTSFTFDDLDRVLTVTTPAPAAGESAQVTTSVYDEAGRVIRTQAPDGLWTTNEYYLTGLYRKTSGARVYPEEYTYDYAGRKATMTTWQDYAGSAGAAVTQWKYDGSRGFLTNKVYQGTNGPGYTHTKAGRPSTRTWARGLATTYAYDNAGDLQTADYSDSTSDVTYTYDRQGRPAQITGATTNDFAYTAAGLLLSENVVNKSWNYASQNRIGYDALQRRIGLTNLSLGLTHTYAYDAASRLQIVSTLHSGASSLINYSYLSNSPLVGGLTFQQGGTTRLTVSKGYDNLNRLRQINSVTNAQAVASFAYAYNAANQRTAVTNADGSRWAFGYDRLGQVTNGWRYWSDGNDVLGQTFNYSFDDIGNRKSAGAGTPGTQRTQSYGVNLLNQYTNRTVPGYLEVNGSADAAATVTVNGASPSRQGEYYRQEVSVNNASAGLVQWLTSRATNATGTSVVARLSFVPQTPEAFTHDADGNLTQDGLWNYTWDGENRLTRVETRTNAITDSAFWQRVDSTYAYQSLRVRKQISTWNPSAIGYQLSASYRFSYDGWNLVGQVDEVTGTRLSFVWGSDLSGTMQGAGGVGGLKAMFVHNGSLAGTYFYSYDGNGNVAALINAADGTEAARYEYGPFLELLRATGPLARLNPFRASTKYQDDETDLLYYGYRYLSTVTGRWLSRDPFEEQGCRNIYVFTENSPSGRVDPLGLFDVASFLALVIPPTDPGRDFAVEHFRHYQYNNGAPFLRSGGAWGDFMKARPEIRSAVRKELARLAQNRLSLVAGNYTGRINSMIVPIRLDQLDSMLLTLHEAHHLQVQGTIEIACKAGEAKVFFKQMTFTWVDDGNLKPGINTYLKSGVVIPEEVFIFFAQFFEKAKGYAITIMWGGDSVWHYNRSSGKLFIFDGWPKITTEDRDYENRKK